MIIPNPPQSICILRLSAIGDVCHTAAIVCLLQKHFPHTKITWIIGKLEATLVSDMPGIEFIIFDKKQGIKAYWGLRNTLKNRHFDVLMHMQTSMRAHIASLLISAKVRLGFDKARAKDFQWLFTNQKIKPEPRAHVIEGLWGFANALGITDQTFEWRIPIPQADQTWAKQFISEKPILLIAPASSMSYRNWIAQGYASVARYAIEKYNMHVILCGGRSPIELSLADAIQKEVPHEITNLTGKTTLKQLLALIEQACILISPDTGPAHMAAITKTPVIGLYACTNPKRAAPYLSQDFVVNRYEDAILKKYGKPSSELRFGIRVKDPFAMQLITVEDVCGMLDKILKISQRIHYLNHLSTESFLNLDV